MEKGIDAYIREQFELADVDIRTYSPLTLAYIGDCIFDLIILLGICSCKFPILSECGSAW